MLQFHGPRRKVSSRRVRASLRAYCLLIAIGVGASGSFLLSADYAPPRPVSWTAILVAPAEAKEKKEKSSSSGGEAAKQLAEMQREQAKQAAEVQREQAKQASEISREATKQATE